MREHALVELAESQHGVVTRRQLRELGVSRDAVRHLVRSGQWSEETDVVLRRVGSPRTNAQSVMVAVLDSGRGAALSHLSAGRWWGLSGCPLRPVNVVRTSASRRSSGIARIHKVRVLPPDWVTTLRGVRVVRPELLSLHLFAVCSDGRAERLTDRLWSMRLLSGPSIDRFLDDHGRRGRNGTAGLRTYLEARGPGYVPPASGLESRFMALMAEAGILMRRQVDSGGSENWTGRVDFRHVVLPLIVEIQSEAFHMALCDQTADAIRISQLRANGFAVLEITDTQVWSDPGGTIDRLRRFVVDVQRRLS